jgi:hypothetical protein
MKRAIFESSLVYPLNYRSREFYRYTRFLNLGLKNVWVDSLPKKIDFYFEN